MEYAYPEPPHSLGAVAGKSADPAPDVRARDAPVLLPEQLEPPAGVAPCTPVEVLSGERSCAATAHAQSVPLVSPLSEREVVSWQLAARALRKAESQPLEASPPADSPDAPELALPEARQPMLGAAPPAAPEQKMSASRSGSER